MVEPVDPAHLDVVAQPRRRRRAKVPENMKPMLAKAERRARARPAAPGITIDHAPGDYEGDRRSYRSPYVEREAWELMLADAFGTRSVATIQTFIDQLAEMCRKRWDHETNKWERDEGELNQCLNIVNGIRPKNEAEAALAVQNCAVHLTQMRIAGRALSGGWIDPKDAYAIAALARASAHIWDAPNRGRGKGKTTKQKIEVRYERHNHQHVHIEGGDGDSGYQPHATAGTATADKTLRLARAKAAPGAPLQSPDAKGPEVSGGGCERKARVSDARRKGIGSAKG